jgi:predicted RNA-binding Zn ribbon-like protein
MAEKHYVIVEDLVLPVLLAGHPALDFCNTRAGWNGGLEGEYLVAYDHLAVWAGFAGLLSAERVQQLRDRAHRHPGAARGALRRAHAARDRIYRALLAPEDGVVLDTFGQDAATAVRHMRLSLVDGEPAWQVDDAAGLTAPTDAVVWSTAQLLTSAERSLVRACPGDGCGWLFFDRSRRRIWCTMTTCGNRAKAKRFADRHRDRP